MTYISDTIPRIKNGIEGTASYTKSPYSRAPIGQAKGQAIGQAAMEEAYSTKEDNSFYALVDSLTEHSSPAATNEARLTGDITSSFSGSYTRAQDKVSLPRGAAIEKSKGRTVKDTIDRTSVLYEKSLELESYFVKSMLSSMRKTLDTSGLSGENSNARRLYEDLLYDEYAMNMTRNAGFGLSDQIYLELTRH